MSRAPVILNPIAGGGRLRRSTGAIRSTAAEHGHEIEIWVSESPAHTTELAERAAADGLPLVIAFGGDGTYNAVARGLVGSSTAMAVLPGGTTSVLAYEFDVPRPVGNAIRALLDGHDREMRVGRTDHGEIVLLMLSAGPDSVVLERVRPLFKRLGGRAGVALQAVVETVSGVALPRIRVTSDDFVGDAGWVIVGKSRCYAGPFRATPGADPFRGDLEVIAQRTSGRRAAAGFLAGIPAGRHVTRRDVVREITSRVRLEPAVAGQSIPYQVDGDVVGRLPVEISLDPRPLLIRLPAAPAGPRSASGDPAG